MSQCNTLLLADTAFDPTGPATKRNLSAEQIAMIGSSLNFACAADAIAAQDKQMAAHRLHIPMLLMMDVIHGYRTSFPLPLAVASSFDTDLMEECTRMAAKKADIAILCLGERQEYSSEGKDGNIGVAIVLINTGKIAGKEVVQLYLHDKVASTVRPVCQLIDFKKVALEAGETTTVTFTVTEEQLRIWSKTKNGRAKRANSPSLPAIPPTFSSPPKTGRFPLEKAQKAPLLSRLGFCF